MMQKELLKMFSDYLEDVEYLDNEHKEMLMVLAMESEKLLPFMYDCYGCITQQLERAELKEKQLSFYMDEECYLKWGMQEFVLNINDARELIARFIDILEPIYPLGTVVALKEDFSRSLKLKSHINQVKVVIIERFASTKEKDAYFPYVGIVYPVGMLGHGKCIHFTNALVDHVVHMGYRDEMDDAYILLMKKELILDNDAMSCGFLTKEEVEEYREELGMTNE